MVNKKYPIIGISGSIIIDENGAFPGFERSYVNNDYIQSVAINNGIPYIIPIIYDDELIKQQVINIDALILSGGHDVNSLMWGEEPHNKLEAILPKRDEFDMKLLKYALAMKKPILGICRGQQIINVVEGGTLYQDLSLVEESYIKHNQKYLPSIATHTINIKKGTKLYNIIGEEEILVNSFHHMAVNKVAEGYIVSAISKDGIIEGIEKTGDDFIIAVQWHPEMMTKESDTMRRIFKALVKSASRALI